MTTILDPRKTLNSSVLLLALFILGLTASWAWHGFSEYRATRQMLAANRIVDFIIQSAAIQAVERGLTSVAIGAGLSPLQSIRDRIKDIRESGDLFWQRGIDEAMTLAAQLGDTEEIPSALTEALAGYQQLQAARSRVDRFLETGDRTITGTEWFATITHSIAVTGQLREAVLGSVDLPGEVARLNHSLKRSVWLASEYAGRERGILAFYVGARLALPTDTLENLRTYRGIVDAHLDEIRALKQRTGVDRRLLSAVESVENDFLGTFDAIRQSAYSGASSGLYPLTASEWMEASTHAINTILAVASTATDLCASYAEEKAVAVTRQVLINLGLLLVATVLVVLNLNKVRQTTNCLYRQKELAEVTLHSIGDAVITTDARGRVEYLNPVAEEVTGWSTTRASGKPLSEIFQVVNSLSRESEPNPIERCLREGRVVGLDTNSVLVRTDGKEIAIDDSAAPIRNRDGEIVGAVMVFYDVTSMRSASHLLSYHATHDPLTKLINRREFERRLGELLLRSKNQGEQHALCYLDLDQFKIVNDTCGHKAGDALLRQLTYLLQERVRETDTLARIGGDEFGLLLQHCSLEHGRRIAENIRQMVKDFRFVWEHRTFELSVSIGLVPITADSVSAAEILSEADAACFAAKDHGRNCIQIYEPANTELARRHGEMQWVSRITDALSADRFVLYCQPIVSFLGEGSKHCETLVRMLDEDRQLVPPMTFIPAAERYNLMPEIDRWVIGQAIKRLGHYLFANPQDELICSINISGASLGNPLQDFIFQQLTLNGVPPHMICLEITETAAVANFEQAVEFIKPLRQHGCRFALDDFGSGLSSFVYLKNLPVDYLKIDGSLIKGIAEDRTSYGMVQAIHRVAQIMGLQTVAEFVGDRETWNALRELEIDYAQGYFISEPLPMDEAMLQGLNNPIVSRL